jgi:hypothetical protein
MILLWVMSILMYLTWAITQLGQYLVLELKTIAVYQGHLEDFQKTEHVLLAYEQSLLEPASLESSQLKITYSQSPAKSTPMPCIIEASGLVEPSKESSKNVIPNPNPKRLYHIRVGDRIRMESTIVVDHLAGTLTRLNWQQLYD